jgi:hypothetical protein
MCPFRFLLRGARGTKSWPGGGSDFHKDRRAWTWELEAAPTKIHAPSNCDKQCRASESGIEAAKLFVKIAGADRFRKSAYFLVLSKAREVSWRWH